MRSIRQSFVCLLPLFFATAVWADQVIEKPVAADSPEKFAQTTDRIHHEMDAGGRYEFIKPEEKAMVEADLNSMASMLEKSGSVPAMTQPEKLNLIHTQEHVNGILTHSDSNRLICQHAGLTSTTIPRTTCDTVGDIERNRKGIRKTLDDIRLNTSVCNIAKYCKSN